MMEDEIHDSQLGSKEYPKIYPLDIARHKRTGSIGLVNRVGDINEDVDKKTLKPNHIHVLWRDDTRPVQDAKDVTVLDRHFLHGEYVASANGLTGQIGVVMDVEISVDLLALDGSTYKNISTKDLRRIRYYASGDYVIHLGEGWLGRISEVLDDVTLRFDNGSLCSLQCVKPHRLQPIGMNKIQESSNLVYYPDQRVKACSASVFKKAKWLRGKLDPNCLEATVTTATAGSVFVDWIASADIGADSSYPPPEKHKCDFTLTLLSCHLCAKWQLGDWGTYDGGEEYRREKDFQIVDKRTMVKVLWQDGTIEVSQATLLVPITITDSDFIPEQYVVEKALDEVDDVTAPMRNGIVKSVDARERTACVRWLKKIPTVKECTIQFEKEETVSVYELKCHPLYDYNYGEVVVRLDGASEYGLSWAGNITSLKDGYIGVVCANGMESRDVPEAIYVVGEGDDYESDGSESEEIDVAGSEITNADVDEPAAAGIEAIDADDDEPGSAGIEATDASEDDFKRFDVLDDPSDHHFRDEAGQEPKEIQWVKKVNQDWKILKKDLPDGMYVRVYEDRMDLLRAVIVGACGTPYQDGLFCFDFHLPPDYPGVPPSAYYHSRGLRLNPNLYEDGKICLSLLNTWRGKGNEVWSSKISTIFQVLVSLQGLVLNPNPYFNEAGYDKQVGSEEGKKNSLSYNEDTFLLNCRSMRYLIQKPPKGFEELIKEHFRKQGYYILKACDAYMKGYLIGSLSEDALVNDERNSASSTSAGFKKTLAKIMPKLFAELNKVGADCNEFKHLQEEERME